ncbi:ABC transporter ATP-binding protein [Streptosporangium amethystogenes subsp. fukuiense]|uniref:ABC transporter ATP-binding protein n=1 Tax=Streptosporangium amethystogenes subsp. fukuiense TaxID=698418 RepID=A0ABW2SZP3_9ACTN
MGTVLELRNLTIEAATARGTQVLVDAVDLTLEGGEILGLIGESGSGKTTTVRSVLGLLDRNVSVASGEVVVLGEQVQAPGRQNVDRVRGRHVGMVFQGASSSLNPLMRVRRQLREVVRTHLPKLSAEERDTRIAHVISRMGFTEVDRVLDSFPHQLSGGMRQRIAIALAVVTEPEVLITDECTSALDVTTQAEVVDLLGSLTAGSGMGTVFVTHDLMLASEICDRIAVMYAGQIVEMGTAKDVVHRPRHPYTRALLAAIPSWDGGEIKAIDGAAPRITEDWTGCRFAPRCPRAEQICTTGQVPWVEVPGGDHARCHFALENDRGEAFLPASSQA